MPFLAPTPPGHPGHPGLVTFSRRKPSQERKSGASCCCVTAAKPLQLLTAQDITAVIHRHRIHIPWLLSITHICSGCTGQGAGVLQDQRDAPFGGRGGWRWVGGIVPQYSDASGIYDASNQIEWRAAVSFVFYLPKEPQSGSSLRLVLFLFLALILCSDKFFCVLLASCAPPSPSPIGIKNCAKLSAFCTFSSLIINGCCSLTWGTNEEGAGAGAGRRGGGS